MLLFLPRPGSLPSSSRARVVLAVSDGDSSHLEHSDPLQSRQQGPERKIGTHQPPGTVGGERARGGGSGHAARA